VELQQGERVATCLGDDAVAQPVVQWSGDHGVQQCSRVRVAEPVDRQPGQPVQAVVVPLTNGEHDADGFGEQPPGDEREGVRRCPVEPLGVVHHADQRPLLGQAGEQGEDGQAHQEAIRGSAVLQAERRAERVVLGSGRLSRRSTKGVQTWGGVGPLRRGGRGGLGPRRAGWSVTGESPLGHVALRLVLLHALWDSWIHERDVLLPLGLAPVLEPDEVVACLAYAAALGPALLAAGGSVRRGTLAVDGSEPEAQIIVDVGSTVLLRLDTAAGAARLTGRAVDLIEGLSFRAPLTADVADADRWLLSGLDAAFDVA
jgi:hypothetical protein